MFFKPPMVKAQTMFMDPMSPFYLAMDAARIGLEAQTVIALRLAGMAGLWDTPASEMTRMMTEKPRAAAEAVEAATRAVLRGSTADEAMRAGLAEIGRHTSGNVQRLTKMGPARLASF